VKLNWRGREVIGAPRDAVWAFINDPGEVARCMPDLISADVTGPRRVDALVHVTLGLVVTRFRYDVVLEPAEPGRRMVVKIGGGGFGNALQLTAAADLEDDGDAATSLLWRAEATLSGAIALVGWPVVEVKAQRIIRQTFANVKAHFAPVPPPRSIH
jgi:carbon monoxide dehydrogenase subunit G